MKPNFALTLSFDGIGLLHRAFPGWHLVGDVNLETDDLARDLADLRGKAQLLDPSGLRCKLVLPNDQIRYMQIDLPETGDALGAVKFALDGATPYAVADLAFDWVEKAGKIHIAAVARETLAEAEAFAIEHQFNPLSFVAQPANGAYAGEPFFGMTRHAVAQGIEPDGLERDNTPIRIIGATKLPEGEPPAAEDADPDAAPDRAGAREQDNAAEAAAKELKDAKPDAAHDAPNAAFSSIRDPATAAVPRLVGVNRDSVAPRITLAAGASTSAQDNAPPITGIAASALPEEQARPLANVVSHSDRTTVSVEAAGASLAPPAPYSDPESTRQSGFFATRRQRKALPTTPEEERQRMTVFGARDKTSVRGKPRFLGLILTAALLLFLIGVAAWASIFSEDGLARFFRKDETVPIVASTPSPEELEDVAAEDAEVTDLASLDQDVPVSVLEDPATEILSRITPRDLSPDEAKARYAATGIWQLAPEPPANAEPTQMEAFYQTTLEPPPDFRDAVALPEATAAFRDGIFFSPPSPPASDTRFVLDARGFVQATVDGALTPDAVRVFAGRPAVLPPDILRGATGETAQAGPTPQADDGQQAPETTAQDTAPQTAQATLRPRVRPEDAAEQIERNNLGGRTRAELVALRPEPRPQSLQEAAEAAAEVARAEAQAAVAAAQAEAVDPAALEGAIAEAVAAPDPFAGATSQAVQASLKPKVPPRNFEKIIANTKRMTQQQEVSTPKDDEPVRVSAAQKVVPKIPSVANVTKAATDKNALKFQRVNLIGVYGTPSNRRALVRMSSGRYKKVKVGDKLDGGRVTAIGDGDLRYQKGGRNIKLQMPRG